MTEKIDDKKVEEAAADLNKIQELVMKFQEHYKILNNQERALVGGIVLSLNCPHLDLDANGFVGNDHLTVYLIERLRVGFRNQKVMEGQQKEQQILN